MPKRPKLTPKQRLFIAEYQVDSNATQAAIRAGYSEDTARQIGCENLAKPYIAKALARAEKIRSERLEITADRIAVELKRIAFADLRDLVQVAEGRVSVSDTANLTEEQAASLSEIQQTKDGIRIKQHSKIAALDQLGKILGLHRESLDVNQSGPPPVFNINPARPSPRDRD